MIVDGIKLDEENKKFNSAADFVKETNEIVFLTGKAGTGKTTFLKYLRKIIKKTLQFWPRLVLRQLMQVDKQSTLFFKLDQVFTFLMTRG